MNANHPFEIGGRYRNTFGEYTVLAIDGEAMTVRFDDGREKVMKTEIQARIWQRYLDEEESESIRRKRGDVIDDSLDTAPVRDLVQKILRAHFSPPYPGDITDQVCLAIEANPDWLDTYWELVKHFSSGGKNGRLTVNSSLGWWTKDLTGMTTVEFPVKSKTRELIQSYSRLGYAG